MTAAVRMPLMTGSEPADFVLRLLSLIVSWASLVL